MTPAELAVAVLDAAHAALTERGVDPYILPATISVERPRNPEHGDYASTIALQLSKQAGVPSRELAAAVAAYLRQAPSIASVDVAGPGFLNVRLSATAAGAIARLVVEAGQAYGRSDVLANQRVNLEFVLANPTGPGHLEHTRWAAAGDALGRILTAAGADVTREYRVNDAGGQLARFGEPVEAAARKSLERFGVHIDVWFSERALHEGGLIEHALDELRRQGHVYQADDAVWLRTTDFGDDKDRVLVRGSGEKSYFAAEAAYYISKRERGFDQCIYLLGTDHHGYVGRLRTIAACAGDDPNQTLVVLVGQLVSLLRSGEPVRPSGRAGTSVTLDELVDAVGVDATRYCIARSPADSPLALDIEMITRQNNDNPVFYVRYVAARTASVARNAADIGLARSVEFDPALLVHEKELDLLKALGDFPAIVATAAERREPHRVARYLEDLAGTYHGFHDNCRVLPQGDEPVAERSRARLWLNDATRVVIANGLDLLGVSAPERM